MIALYLLAAHLVGDFVLQTRWQAAAKLEDRSYRVAHVASYSLPFLPLAIIYGTDPYGASAFLVGLVVLHYLTDSWRFRSTLGDVIAWRVALRRDEAACVTAWLDYLYGRGPAAGTMPSMDDLRIRHERARAIESITSGGRLRFPPPNPWPSASLMIDQALHVVQIALLAGLFLR